MEVPVAALSSLSSATREGLRAAVTNGSTGFSSQAMECLPQLALIACLGAGYEGVDLDAAGTRGIPVTCARGANAATVADHAIGLMLAVMRDIPARDAAVRAGMFSTSRSERPTASGSRLGIIGLGQIGQAIAQRGAAFGMQVSYCTRRAVACQPWRYVADLVDLAAASDVLVAACPGGAETYHIVDAKILQALGPNGVLINIARGSVVDTAALADALRRGIIAGAGLDVWEGEPELPASLQAARNVVLTPHMAGRSPNALIQQASTLVENLEALFAGQPLRPDTLVMRPSLA